jgi:hypothetical protein
LVLEQTRFCDRDFSTENTVVAGSVERSHAQKFPSSMAERKSVAILPRYHLRGHH